MPTYVYQCPKCLATVELIRPMNQRNKLPVCPDDQAHGRMRRSVGLERCGTDCKDWRKPVLSESMGVSPSQVAEHRRQHPDIPLTDTGEIIIRNGAEERRIKKQLAEAFRLDGPGGFG